MTTITFTERYTNQEDRSEWGRGPWDNEPEDKLVWKDEKTGLDCMMLRNGSGAWCGYVGVPEYHDMHGVEYYKDDNLTFLSVHGGLSYSAGCSGHICHLGDEETGHVWWFGFDCGHSNDRVPNPGMWTANYSWSEYRTKEYVISEIQQLALDLVHMKRSEDDDDDDDDENYSVVDTIVSML